MSWHVIPRALVAIFGTLALSVAFAFSIGYAEGTVFIWTFTCGLVWLTWVFPPPKTSRTRWWHIRTAAQLLAWILVFWLVAALLVLLLIPQS